MPRDCRNPAIAASITRIAGDVLTGAAPCSVCWRTWKSIAAPSNRFGLQDAVRAIDRDSGGLATEWPIERVLKTGDAAVGAPVLEDLYAQMKDTPVTPDLMGLWRKLGVEPDGSSVRLTDDAPLAEMRQSIMQSRAALIPVKRTSSSPR